MRRTRTLDGSGCSAPHSRQTIGSHSSRTSLKLGALSNFLRVGRRGSRSTLVSTSQRCPRFPRMLFLHRDEPKQNPGIDARTLTSRDHLDHCTAGDPPEDVPPITDGSHLTG